MSSVAVSSEAVAEFLPFINRVASRMDGKHQAEFDDLVQEGMLHSFLKLRAGERPSHTGIKNAMIDWLRVCARRGLTDTLPEESDGLSAEA